MVIGRSLACIPGRIDGDELRGRERQRAWAHLEPAIESNSSPCFREVLKRSQHLEEDDAQIIGGRCRRGGMARPPDGVAELLGGHVGEGAEERAGLGDFLASVASGAGRGSGLRRADSALRRSSSRKASASGIGLIGGAANSAGST